MCHLKEVGCYPQCLWEPLKTFKQESNVLVFEIRIISRMVAWRICQNGGDTGGRKTN